MSKRHMKSLRRWRYPKRGRVRHRASAIPTSKYRRWGYWWRSCLVRFASAAAVALFAIALYFARLDCPVPVFVVGAIAHRASVGANEADPTTGGTFTIPASTQTADLIIVPILTRNAGGLATLTDDDSGGNTWTRVTALDAGDGTTHHTWQKYATSGTASKTVTWSSTAGCSVGVLAVYSGADQSKAIYNTSVEDNASGDETHAGYTPDFANSMICLTTFNANISSAVTSPACTSPGALTIRAEDFSTGGGFNIGVMHASALQSGVQTATGSFTWTQANGAGQSTVFSIIPVQDVRYKALKFQILSTVAAGNTIDLTGFGFQPAVYRVWKNGRSSTVDAQGSADAQLGVGVGVSSSERGSISLFYDDGQAAQTGGSRIDDAAVMQTVDATGAITGSLDHDSYLSDGIRVIVDDQFPANIDIIVEAWGGAIQVKLLNASVDVSTTGDKDITGVGFNPGTDSYIFAFGSLLYTTAPPNAQEDFIQFMVGNARTKSSVKQNVFVINSDDDSTTMDTDRYSRTDEFLAGIDVAGAASCNIRATFVDAITDGFRINVSETVGGSNRRLFFMVIKGIEVDLGSFAVLNSAGTDHVASGLGFIPIGITCMSTCQNDPLSDQPAGGAEFSIGAATGVNDEIAMAFQDEDATANEETSTAIGIGEIYLNLSTAAAIEGRLSVQSIDADGFTLNEDTADPSGSRVRWIAYGIPPPAAAGGTYPALERVVRGVARGVTTGAR